MPGIEDARTGLDELSGQVEQYGQDILDITNEEPYDSLAERALRAGQLATELAGLMEGIDTDVDVYTRTLRSFDDKSEYVQKLKDAANAAIAGGSAVLASIPEEINSLSLLGVTSPAGIIGHNVRPVAGYVANIRRAGAGMGKLGETLAQQKTRAIEEVQQRTAQIKAHIERGKTNL